MLFSKPYTIFNEDDAEFTWEGQDEMDPASGSGWLKLSGKEKGRGRMKFHMTDEHQTAKIFILG